MPRLLVAGHVLSRAFQEARLVAEDVLHVDDTNLQLEVKPMLEYKWVEYLRAQKLALGGKCVEHDSTQPLVVHSALGYLGGLEELILWATRHVSDYADPRAEPEYAAVEDELQTIAEREFAATVAAAPEGSFVYLDFGSDELDALASGAADGGVSRPMTAATPQSRRRTMDNNGGGGSGGNGGNGDFGPHRIVIELFRAKCPRSAENFRRLCTGESGEATRADGSRFALHYANSIVHRVVPSGWVQCGDIVSGRGCDGHSALGSQTFPDENLSIPIDAPGLVCMANNGPHTNASQFFITQRELPAWNGKYVVVGRVVYGLHTLRLLDQLSIKANQRPQTPLRIVASDVFTAAMLDDNVNKWTRRRAAKKKRAPAPGANGAARAGSDTPRVAPKKATLLVVGFDSSGKSSLVHNLAGRPFEPTNPTVGFERTALSVPPRDGGLLSCPFDVQVWGLGGARNIRGYWYNYLDAVHGLVFVVDASLGLDQDQAWSELRAEFQRLCAHPLVQGKPVLVYANKQDAPGALSAAEVGMRLGVSATGQGAPNGGEEGDLLRVVKCTARPDLSAGSKGRPPLDSPLSPASAAFNPSPSPTAVSGAGGPASFGSAADVDPDIPRGLAWLLSRIASQYQSLSERVSRDIVEQKRKAKEEMEARRARMAREKEEREAAEAAAAAAGGQ